MSEPVSAEERRKVRALSTSDPTPDRHREARMKADLSECECVPGHRCDCTVLRQLLMDILTNAEYPKMEAEGLAAAGLGLVWSESQDRYVRKVTSRV